jgi:hypothetical protein
LLPAAKVITLLITVLTLAGCSRQPASAAPPQPNDSQRPVQAQSTTTATAADSTSEPEDQVTVSGPMAIGFFPPITEKEWDEDGGGLSEGHAHLGFALEDVRECLTPRRISLQIKMTRSLSVKDGANSYRYDFPTDWAYAVGIMLADSDREPVVVYATAGPSSLSQLAPQAAWKYFSEPNCKRYEE